MIFKMYNIKNHYLVLHYLTITTETPLLNLAANQHIIITSK